MVVDKLRLWGSEKKDDGRESCFIFLPFSNTGWLVRSVDLPLVMHNDSRSPLGIRICSTLVTKMWSLKNTTDTSVTSHWLAIEGIQPAILENASIEAPSDGKKVEYKEDGLSVDVKLPIKHVLSRELQTNLVAMQLYFDKIVDITMNKSVSILFKQALLSLEIDSGLHPLVPYFTCFIADKVVAQNLNNFPLMFALMLVAQTLLQNEHLHIEPYLHQLMPSIITCLVAKRLGKKFTDNHWELRNFAAKLVASICKSYKLGSILEAHLQLLEPEIKRHEAWRVYRALLSASTPNSSCLEKQQQSCDKYDFFEPSYLHLIHKYLLPLYNIPFSDQSR
ncbi:hypothetical protein PVK06_042773 [Gossypium arboreum]|uniref:TAF6 C-terminal HEAT repeat domain-containing protein n=1 Tax=Gossypium arboreum TaxID=29729 RepID=A0ABR0MM32_GOSAR|nr:hypothetical protein PVK06_042773 [Gossypium arboreum]